VNLGQSVSLRVLHLFWKRTCVD